MKNIILCGLPRSGKTSVGIELSKVLSKSFIDTDKLIEQCYYEKFKKKYGCKDIFLVKGESFFRKMEQDIIVSLNVENSVISLGGGAFADLKVIDHLKNLGMIVYLKSCEKVLFERMLTTGLPAYLQTQIRPFDFFCQIAETRTAYFETYANVNVNTQDKNISELAEFIADIFSQELGFCGR